MALTAPALALAMALVAASAQAPSEATRGALGLHVGAMFPQVASSLDTALALRFEALSGGSIFGRAAAVPKLQLGFELSYVRASRSYHTSDARLASGTARLELSHEQLAPGVCAVLRVWRLWQVDVFLRSALFLALQRSRVFGRAGAPFGQNDQASTQLGGALAVGGEWQVGPGAAVIDGSFSLAPMHHRLVGDTWSGGLNVQLGYRLFL